MGEQEFFEKGLTLSFEFSRYVLAHPDIEDQIPKGALVAFLIADDPAFNERSLALARQRREEGQPVVLVKVEGLAPPMTSRLINPQLELSPRI